MKKLFALVLCLVFSLSLASCGGDDSTSKESSTSASSKTTSVTENTDASKNAEINSSSKASDKSKKKKSKKSSKSKKSDTADIDLSRYFSAHKWMSLNERDDVLTLTLNEGGTAHAIILDSKGVIIYDSGVVNDVWNLSGTTLTLSSETSDADDVDNTYTYKNIGDKAFDNIKLKKSDGRYKNCALLEDTGLRENEFYISDKYYCYYTGSDNGVKYCSLYCAPDYYNEVFK